MGKALPGEGDREGSLEGLLSSCRQENIGAGCGKFTFFRTPPDLYARSRKTISRFPPLTVFPCGIDLSGFRRSRLLRLRKKDLPGTQPADNREGEISALFGDFLKAPVNPLARHPAVFHHP